VRELDAFVTSAPIGVAFCAEGVIKRVNHALARMLGATEEALHGQPDALFRGDPAARSEEDPGGDDDGTWVRHRTTGRSLWLQLDEHQTGQGTWWMVQDRTDYRTAQRQLLTRVTELRETNERLAEAQNKLLQQEKMASIGQLAAGVAHEINNPVGFVNSNLNTLRQNVDDLMRLVQAQAEALEAADPALGEKPRRLGEEIDITYLREDLPVLLAECAEGLDRVRKIVQDLKDFSRVDNLDWQAADLISGLESTLNVVRHEVRYRADVVRKIEPLPLVQCLPAQINQVFMNLIVNAAQAIENHGTITLSSGVVDGWVWVQVDDTGCGMSEDVRRRIFEPFFTTKDVGKGTGLGLSLSFSIIDKHGGQIQVRSVPGEGSSFRVWLPVDGPKQGQRREPPAWT
jgi:signal transduction histidine kinase